VKLSVWAPAASSVVVRTAAADVPAVRAESGYWTGESDLQPGDHYSYVVDGEHVVPDPRSRWQPDGVHAASAVFDSSEYRWGDDSWSGRALDGSVIYELHIGTFTLEGTLDAAICKLDYLAELGIDFVELLPVNAFNGVHDWGYDGVLWFAVHETYGGPAAYQRFVDACHQRGLGVIQDVVYNHLGPSGNYLPVFGPYLSEATENTWGASINLSEPEVRRYILDNARMWLADYHVDGLRLDAVHALVDTGPVHLLAELAAETAALSEQVGRPLSLIAESDLNDPVLFTAAANGGYGLTAQWDDDFHHALHVALTGETAGYYEDFSSLAALAKVATRGFFHDGTYSSFRGRPHGKPIDPEESTSRLVVYSQDHDQIGNRAAGDRLSQSLELNRLMIAATLVIAGPFTPMLFMGEEWGASTPWQFFTSHPEPELARVTAEGRIEEFERMGWDSSVVPDPQDAGTFSRSKLNWSENETGDHERLLETYRELLHLRRDELGESLRFADLSAQYDESAGWFRLDRKSVSILVNFSDAAVRLGLGAASRLLFATDEEFGIEGHDVTLPALSAAVLRRQKPGGTP
jgi:maltooligosyltrehalose trehalohydrolase